jgi:ubiquinone/menaquinone biosynthesis C-methylase UbiE
MRDELRRVVRRGYDDVAESYLADRTSNGGDVAMLRELLSRLAPGSGVLDAGCGAGVPVMKLLTEAQHRVVGLDFSARQLSLAHSRVPGADLVHGDLSALPFPHQRFDAVVSFYAIIHVPRRDHPAILHECHRVLRPGGLALLCLGANDVAEDHDPTSWLGTAMYWSHYDAATNLGLLRDAHLDVISDRLVPDPMGHSGHLFALAIRR